MILNECLELFLFYFKCKNIFSLFPKREKDKNTIDQQLFFLSRVNQSFYYSNQAETIHIPLNHPIITNK